MEILDAFFMTFFKPRLVFKCNKESPPKRVFTSLKKRVERDLKSKIESSPFVMIPFVILNKNGCREKGNAKHRFVMLYNKKTNEVERIDIRRYHIEGFKIKRFIKLFSNSFLPEWFSEETLFTPDLDVTLTFMNKHGFENPTAAFPVYLICYLFLRSRFPNKPSFTIQQKIEGLSSKHVQFYWNNYVEFINSVPEPACVSDNKMFIPENNICVKTDSKKAVQRMITKPPLNCSMGKVEHPVLRRCVSEKSVKNIDILLNRLKTVDQQMKLDSFDKDKYIVVGLMNYIANQFNYIGFVRPIKTGSKRDLSLVWAYNPETKAFDFKLPKDFEQSWNEHLFDPSKRFIAVFISMKSSGSNPGIHANALLFDKKTKELERFDGLGRDASSLYNINGLDEKIKEVFKPYFNKYFSPLDFCPKHPVFQSLEIDQIPGGDLRGNCAVWRLWYIHMRMLNPHLTRKEVVRLAHAKLDDTGSLYKYIKSYQDFMLEESRNYIPQRTASSSS
jgi:hypothetical protein